MEVTEELWEVESSALNRNFQDDTPGHEGESAHRGTKPCLHPDDVKLSILLPG
jgi:hypothetical protein